jgi:hypothetical protein
MRFQIATFETLLLAFLLSPENVAEQSCGAATTWALPTATEQRSLSPDRLSDGEALPSDPTERKLRLKKNSRYTGGVCNLMEDVPGRVCIEQYYPRGTTVMPIEETDFSALGTVTSLKTYLSSDRTRIYTEISLKIEEAFRIPKRSRLENGGTVVIDRLGGAVRLSSGRVVCDETTVDYLGRTREGGRFVLFAKWIHHQKDLTLIRGYEIRDGRVFYLLSDYTKPGEPPQPVPPDDSWLPSQEAEFLQALRARAAVFDRGRSIW